jgi:ATP-dependent RNA helicase DDX54/DBP10
MSFFGCREDDKAAVLIHLLKNVIDQSEQTFVFAPTKHHIEYLNMVGIACDCCLTPTQQFFSYIMARTS